MRLFPSFFPRLAGFARPCWIPPHASPCVSAAWHPLSESLRPSAPAAAGRSFLPSSRTRFKSFAGFAAPEHMDSTSPAAMALTTRPWSAQFFCSSTKLSRRLGLKFKAFLLIRTKPRPDRLRLSRRERWTTVRGAYEAREGVRVDNLHVLLVDDVMATGATLDACSRALRKAGAARVTAVTVARSVPNWSAADGTREQPGVPPF
jgi:hypothetical protein